MDGNNPVYLTGYGGFNISMTPAFSRSLLLWLERGGVVAIPNIRGGGEYGEALAPGRHAGPQAEQLRRLHRGGGMADRSRATPRPTRLAAAGGSNGGLLMGAVLTQRPELFRAVVIQVPLLDMLRYHRFLIARLWIPEYGSAEDPEQFRWLRAYSPVPPGARRRGLSGGAARHGRERHPGRPDARAEDGGPAPGGQHLADRPILLRLESRAGHGAGKPLSKVLDELTDTWTFVFSELGVEFVTA